MKLFDKGMVMVRYAVGSACMLPAAAQRGTMNRVMNTYVPVESDYGRRSFPVRIYKRFLPPAWRCRRS